MIVKYGEEARLALGLQEVLKRTHGALCYPELDRCDVVAKLPNGEVWAIECKTQANLKVFGQAWASRHKADRVFVAFPGRFLNSSAGGWGTVDFVRALALKMGIGIFTVSNDYASERRWRTWAPGDPIPEMKVTMQYCGEQQTRSDKRWDALMIPEGETYSIAGGSGVKAWTKTRIWEIEVRKWVTENPGRTCKEILQALRPPGVHKKTGRPLVVRKQDQEQLHYFIKAVFRGFRTEPDPEHFEFTYSKVYVEPL